MKSVIKKDGLSIQVTLSAEEKLETPSSYTDLIKDALDEAV